MSSATRIITAVRGLRDEAGFAPEEADAIGVAAAEAAEAAADRMLIRLGAWTLGVVLGVVSIATAIIIAVIRLGLS